MYVYKVRDKKTNKFRNKTSDIGYTYRIWTSAGKIFYTYPYWAKNLKEDVEIVCYELLKTKVIQKEDI